jgi:hypothetical protein
VNLPPGEFSQRANGDDLMRALLCPVQTRTTPPIGPTVYAGITYGRVTNGLASTFPGTPGAKFGFAGTGTSVDTTSMMTGFRIKI